jgi:glycosyltransferase involved in cell wall biosynthesis
MTSVSVLLAVHNGERFIAEAVESVRAQTHQQWELIVVSNGSTDRTMRICLEMSAADPRIKCLSLSNKNKNAAYNLAFEKSTGDYVCYFAADDVLPPNSLAERLAVLEGAPANAFSTCCLQTFSDDAKYDGVVFPKDVSKPNYAGGSMLFPRSLAGRLFPLPEGQPNEDTWTLLHLQAFGVNRHVPKPLYGYRIHCDNSYGYGLTFEQKREKYLQRMHAYELFRDKFEQERFPLLNEHVVPFLHGLQAAHERNVPRLLLVRGLDLGSKLVLIFYCSRMLYNIRHTYFKALSGGVAK